MQRVVGGAFVLLLHGLGETITGPGAPAGKEGRFDFVAFVFNCGFFFGGEVGGYVVASESTLVEKGLFVLGREHGVDSVVLLGVGFFLVVVILECFPAFG